MILQFNRIKRTNSEYIYSFYQDNNIVGEAFFPYLMGTTSINASINIFELNITMQIPLLFHALTNKSGNGLLNDFTAQFCFNDEFGKIIYEVKKGTNPFNGIYLWNVQLGSDLYKVYEVGKGSKGIYYIVYKNENIIGVISKGMKTLNFLSNYKLYFEDLKYTSLIVSLALYWDVIRYLDGSTSAIHSSENHRLDTWQKELKNKYDPNYIQMIENLERPKT